MHGCLKPKIGKPGKQKGLVTFYTTHNKIRSDANEMQHVRHFALQEGAQPAVPKSSSAQVPKPLDGLYDSQRMEAVILCCAQQGKLACVCPARMQSHHVSSAHVAHLVGQYSLRLRHMCCVSCCL